MTQAARKLLEEFDALEDADRAEVLAELLRRVALAPHDLPNADDLTAAAERPFIELDRREQSQELTCVGWYHRRCSRRDRRIFEPRSGGSLQHK
jgi:hypothetical protein